MAVVFLVQFREGLDQGFRGFDLPLRVARRDDVAVVDQQQGGVAVVGVDELEDDGAGDVAEFVERLLELFFGQRQEPVEPILAQGRFEGAVHILTQLFADGLIGIVVDDERNLKGVITKLDLVDFLTSRVETPG